MKKLLYLIFGLTAGIVFANLAYFGKTNIPKWVNWGGNQKCDPAQIYYPDNKQDLIYIIKQAYANNHKIRAYGSSHAWSNVVCTDYLVNSNNLNRILSVDKDRKLVTVEAGIKIYELNKKLAEYNLALPNQSFTQAQSLAGNIATSTHGTGHTGTFSDFITQLELVTNEGKVLSISQENTPDIFAAARVSVGALGIIYSVTLKCVDLYKVKHKRVLTNWQNISKNYKELHKKHDNFMFFWNPYTDKVLSYIWDKTEQDTTGLYNKLLKMKDKSFTGYWTGEFWVKLLDLIPGLTPKFTNLFYWLGSTGNHVDYAYELMTGAKKSNEEVVYEEEEIAIPAQYILEAAQDVKELVDKYRKEGFYVFMWGILFRFVRADKNSYLSTASDRDTVYISITSAKVNENFYKDFEKAMLKYKGRPHWGKINFLDYNKAKELYGDNLDKFIFVRQKLDPKNIFANSYTSKVFSK